MLNKKEFEIMLILIDNANLSQREIADKTGLSLGSVNKALKSLMENCYYDGRQVTDKGFAVLEQYRVKRAVFLAAGFGSRLVPITLNTPKPLVRVNGKRIIDTLLDAVVAAGIEEIIIVRGYLGEQFDQLKYRYPNIKFVDNPMYNESNNISSAFYVRDLFENAYVLESDLLLSNPSLIRKYEYQSNFLGVPCEMTDDWCFYTEPNGTIIEQSVGGKNCHQMIGISYWNKKDGAMLKTDLEDVFYSPGGKERYWDQVPLLYKKDNYKIVVRECSFSDIIEIDTFNELKKIDKTYDI